MTDSSNLKLHRTVEYTYPNGGGQSVLNIETLRFDHDNSHVLLIRSDSGNQESVMINSRDQLKRLIENLQYVADTYLDAEDPEWERK